MGILFRFLLTLLSCMAMASDTLSQERFFMQIGGGPVQQGEPFFLAFIAEGVDAPLKVEWPGIKGATLLESLEGRGSIMAKKGKTKMPFWCGLLRMSMPTAGQYEIPAATLHYPGRILRSPSRLIQLNVAENDNREAAALPDAGIPVAELSHLKSETSLRDRIRENLFIRTEISDTSCYTGQELQVVYKLYTRLNAVSQVQRRPSFKGFSVLEMVDDYDSEPRVEYWKGQPYYVNLIRKVHLFPLQPGKATLDEAEVQSEVHFTRSFQDSAGYFLNHRAVIRSIPVPIQVKDPPGAETLEGFTGAVGQFILSRRLQKPSVTPGALVQLQVIIAGNGNFPLLVAPAMPWPNNVDTPTVTVRDDFNATRFPLTGIKTYTYQFPAPDSGTVIFPPMSLVVFDPQRKQYMELHADTLALTVAAAPPDKVLKVPIPMDAVSQNFPRQIYGLIIVALLISGWIVFQFWSAYRKRAIPGKAPTPVQVPEAAAADPLSRARDLMASGNVPEFCRELQVVIWRHLTVAYGLHHAQTNLQELSTALQQAGVESSQALAIRALLDTCATVLYMAGEMSPYHMQEKLAQAQQILQYISETRG